MICMMMVMMMVVLMAMVMVIGGLLAASRACRWLLLRVRVSLYLFSVFFLLVSVADAAQI